MRKSEKEKKGARLTAQGLVKSEPQNIEYRRKEFCSGGVIPA
jgi:hypothetical protein